MTVLEAARSKLNLDATDKRLSKALEATPYSCDAADNLLLEDIPALLEYCRLTDAADLVPRSMLDAVIENMSRARRYQNEAQTERDEARAQIAALREAVELIADLPIAHITPLRMRNLRTVFTDTAKAAEGWVKVPEGWGVFPVQSTEEMRESAMDKDCGDYVHDALGYYEDIWDHMIAAAPSVAEEEKR